MNEEPPFAVDLIGADGAVYSLPAAAADEAAALAGYSLKDPRVARVTVYNGPDPAATLRWNREQNAVEVVGGGCVSMDAPPAVGIDWGAVQEGLREFDTVADQVIKSQPIQQAMGPYAGLINTAHGLRMQAMYGEGGPGGAQGKTRGRREARSIIMEAQATTRGARRGEPRAQARIVQLKERAAAGDPEARRTWKIYRLVASADERAIEAATGR